MGICYSRKQQSKIIDEEDHTLNYDQMKDCYQDLISNTDDEEVKKHLREIISIIDHTSEINNTIREEIDNIENDMRNVKNSIQLSVG